MFALPLLHTLSKDKLSVFLFHKVPEVRDPLAPHDFDLAGFESMLDRITRNFTVLPVGDAVDCLRKGSLPRRTACITFDDGYPDWQFGVLPALRRRNMHATFYVTTGQFDHRPLWHERILAAVRGLPDETFDLGYAPLPPKPLKTLLDRQQLVQRLELELKYLTLPKREELMQRLEALAGVSPGAVPVLSPEALRDLHSQGFGVGAHTIDHPILDYCDARQAFHEIGGVKEQLEAMVAGRVDGFAYPNGRPYADFSRLHVDAVKKAGYTHAVTTQWGVAKPETSVFQIPRFTPGQTRMARALPSGAQLADGSHIGPREQFMSATARLKLGLKSAFYRLGVFGLWHWWRNRHVLTVLMFHRVLPAESLAYQLAEREFTFSTTGFDRCLEFVRRHYSVVSLQDVQAAAKNGTELPRNPVLITFDDGWRDTALHAEPLLRKHKMTAVLFLSTEVLDLESCRWWQDAMVAVMADAVCQQRLLAEISRDSAFVLPTDPVEAGRALVAHLASMPAGDRLELLELAQPGVFDAIPERQMLTQDDLRRLDGNAIELGGHGHTHAPLTQAADAQAELKTSMERLKSLGEVPLSMSFPHGAMNESLVNEAHKVGFELVFTSEPNVSVANNAVHATLGRIHVPENRWTCRDGQIDPAQLATFLFFRPHAPVVSNEALA